MSRKMNDFNLMPPKKPSVIFNWVLPMFLFLGTLGAILAAGVLYPQIELAALRYERRSLESQTETLAGLNTEYAELMRRSAEAARVVDAVDIFKNSSTTLLEAYTALNSARPQGVLFTGVDISRGLAEIRGRAGSAAQIQTLARNLEKDERLTMWVISGARQDPADLSWSFEMSAEFESLGEGAAE